MLAIIYLNIDLTKYMKKSEDLILIKSWPNIIAYSVSWYQPEAFLPTPDRMLHIPGQRYSKLDRWLLWFCLGNKSVVKLFALLHICVGDSNIRSQNRDV